MNTEQGQVRQTNWVQEGAGSFHVEDLKTGEVPSGITLILGHGRNWEDYPPSWTTEHLPLRLKRVLDRSPLRRSLGPSVNREFVLQPSLSTVVIATAIGEIATTAHEQTGQWPLIIDSTGPTAGIAYPSEGEEMRRIRGEKYPEIPEKVQLLEKDSLTSVGNILRLQRLLRQLEMEYGQEYQFSNRAVVGIGPHIPRLQLLTKKLGFDAAHFLAAEEYVSPRNLEVVQEYIISGRALKEAQTEEKLLRWTKIDPYNIAPTVAAMVIRNWLRNPPRQLWKRALVY